MYFFQISFSVNDECAYSLIEKIGNDISYVNLRKIDSSLSPVEIEKVIFNKINQNILSEDSLKIKKIRYKLYFYKIIRLMQYKFNEFRLPILDLFKMQTTRYKCYFNFTTLEFAEGIKNAKKNKKIYNSLASDTIPHQKFIFFALHFEPEATIINRGYYSQLYAIRMMSKFLPSDWKIVVKEHPNQFAYYKPRLWIHLFSLKNIKTKQFYANLLKIDKVIILKQEISSDELLEKAQAVATLCSTVCFEAIAENKPLMIFNPLGTVASMVKGTYNITGLSDLCSALSQIVNGKKIFYDKYNEIFSEFLFSCKTSQQDILNEYEINFYEKSLCWLKSQIRKEEM